MFASIFKTALKDKDRAKSFSAIVFEQFLKHKLAVVSASVLIFMTLLAATAPLISKSLGVDPESQNVLFRFAPMMSKVPLPLDEQVIRVNNWSATSSVVASQVAIQLKARSILESRYSAENPADYLTAITEALEAKEITHEQIGQNPSAEIREFIRELDSYQVTHLLGTDELGRDVFSRLLFGARVSLGVAAITVFFSALIGLSVGCLAGFYGGWIDALLMRLTDSFLALPILPLLIVLSAVDLKQAPAIGSLLKQFPPEFESMAKMVFVLALFGWMSIARLVRGNVLSVKELEYVLAARTLGARDGRVISYHVVPNVIAPLLVAVTLQVGEAMIAESALSFLGLGIQPPMASWGNMLQNALELVSSAPVLAVLPGLFIFAISVSVNFVGDGLRDAVDPKAISR